MRHVPENRAFPGLSFFLTMRLRAAIPLADQPRFAQLVIDSLKFYRNRGDILLGAYVVMPDHVHLIIRLGPDITLPWWLNRFKSYVATNFGAGPLWQSGCWSEVLSTQHLYHQKVCYVHLNPVRAGLCEMPEDYPWSSARKYFEGDLTDLDP